MFATMRVLFTAVLVTTPTAVCIILCLAALYSTSLTLDYHPSNPIAYYPHTSERQTVLDKINFICDTFAEDDNLSFPPNFFLGAGVSSYQTEGAWNISDKGESVWDRFVHNTQYVLNGDTGDVACDSYHKYKEDVANLEEIGFDTYRFSLSWSRILPTGFPNKISEDGVNYYTKLIDELLSKGIQPLVTLYHWDHPQVIEELGGWTNEEIVNWFGDYARVVFKKFGHKVKIFTTINEPDIFCVQGYGETNKAPAKNIHGIGEYLCGHNVLKAHARAYHIYNDEFRPTQNGTIGIVLPVRNFYPKNPADNRSVEISFQFNLGWMAHPIFSAEGDYPLLMKEMIAEKSRAQGFPRSRLPEFSPEWIDYIKGTADYMGVNHYSSYLVEPGVDGADPSHTRDTGVVRTQDSKWNKTATIWLKVVPQGLGDVLRKIKAEYNPIIYITENGMSDTGIIDDYQRIQYYHDYLMEMLLAIHRDGVNVKGYVVWSLLDNMEWVKGYSEHFGVVSVDFNDPARTRRLKLSAEWWKTVIRNRRLQPIFSRPSEN